MKWFAVVAVAYLLGSSAAWSQSATRFAAPVASAKLQPPARGESSLPCWDTNLTAGERATDLVGRMTLAEKAAEMQNNSAAVPRLNVPAYQWWSEALHGVINDGVTEYPEPIGLAATFDAPAIHAMAAQIGIEGSSMSKMPARGTPD